MILAAALLASLPFLAQARTDLVGCTSSISGPSLVWYVPGTGELCDFLDCGGGMAPPKTTVPGCVLYSGTATYSPSYLPGWGPNGQSTKTSTAALATTTGNVSSTITDIAVSTTSSVAIVTTPSNGTLSTHATVTSTPSQQSVNAGPTNGVVNPIAIIGAVVGMALL